MSDFSKKRNIVLLVIWILSLVAAVALICVRDWNIQYGIDVIWGTVYGFVIVNSIIFASICAGEEIPPKTLCVALVFGAIIYFSATAFVALILLNIVDDRHRTSSTMVIYFIELALCGVLSAMYIFTAVAIYATKTL